MARSGKFLTAEWKNLLMLNYSVDPSLLQRHVPTGTELDHFDGKTYLSLIGFEFNQTRLSGIAIPFHRSFEEVNLRFYVKRSSKRAVVFISEIVPKYAVAAVARWAFGEKYSYAPMAHSVQILPELDAVNARYSWGIGPTFCSIKIETSGASFLPPEGSLAQFITEHYWGYAAQRNGGSLEYEVLHPQWQVREAKSAGFSGNAAHFYAAPFAEILSRPPDSAFLAEGSTVTVFKGVRI